MASLIKPLSCSKCSNVIFYKLKNPERWICSDCDHVEVSRPSKNKNDECRVCGIKRNDEVEFKKNQNICKSCASENHAKWRGLNIEHRSEYLKKHWTEKGKEARRRSVRQSEERSIESFLGVQARQIKHRCTYDKKRSFANYKEYDVDTDYLLELWNKNGGKCAITGLQMTYKTGSLYTVSIDRIDSNKSYTKNNIQLICKGINFLKNKHTQEETVEFLRSFKTLA